MGKTRTFKVDTSPPPPPVDPPADPPVTPGTPAPGPTPVSPAPTGAVSAKGDVTGPAITVSTLRRSRRATRAGGVRFTLGTIREATTGILSLKTAGRRSAIALGTVAFRLEPRSGAEVRLRLTRKGLASLKRARRLQVRGTIILRDARQNATIKPFSFILTAPK